MAGGNVTPAEAATAAAFGADAGRSRGWASASVATITRRMPDEEKPYRVYRSGRGKGKPRRCRCRTKPTGRPGGHRGPGTRSRASRGGSASGQIFAIVLGLFLAWVDGVVARQLLRVPRRCERGEQAAPRTAAKHALESRAACSSQLDDDAPARNRPLGVAAGTAISLRLDHAHANRPRSSPDLLPLDPARPLRRHPGHGSNASTPPTSWAARPLTPPDRARAATRPQDQPRRDRRLPAVQRADRRDRRHRRRRPRADPVERVRLPLPRRSVPDVDRAGDSRRASSTWTASARSSTRGSARTARPGRQRPDARRAPAAGDPGDLVEAGERRHVLPTCRSSAVTCSSRSRPTSTERLPPARLGQLALRQRARDPLPARRRSRVRRRQRRHPSTEENRNVISMFTGDSAPQPPPPGSGTYGPGCVVGSQTLGSR